MFNSERTERCIKCGGTGYLSSHERSVSDPPNLPPPVREYECDQCEGWGKTFKRPLHVLLPIARQFLVSHEHPVAVYPYDAYTCYAASNAATKDLMTVNEADTLGAALLGALGPGVVFLRAHLVRLGLLTPDVYLEDPAYWPVRDKWLDELQAKWEVARC